MTTVQWLGSHESLLTVMGLEKKFSGALPDKLALSGDVVDNDPVFGVRADRRGLPHIELIGDVAVIKVHGSLVSSWSWWHPYCVGEVLSYEALRDALDIARTSSAVSEIYMDFATGGGSTRGIDTASDDIRRTNLVKPVYGHTDSHAFSAGYWLISSTRRVTASRMAEVGSIGTLMVLPNYSKAAEKAGVEYYVFRAGEFKAVGLPYEELSEEHRKYLQDSVEKTNAFFLSHVSIRRSLMMSDSKTWAEGLTFYAEEAKRVGLIDQVVSLADLLAPKLTATTTQLPQRIYMMGISAEKLAQIAAGAAPESVLSAEELVEYKKALDAGEDNPPANEEGKAKESEESGKTAEESSKPVSPSEAELLKQVGRLEARVEALDEANKELKEQLTAKEACEASLLAVAQVAVNNLQVALGLPKEQKATAAGVVSQFEELRSMMAAKFPTARVTQEPTEDKTQSQVASFRSNPTNTAK